jgi:hypothetical protein
MSYKNRRHWPMPLPEGTRHDWLHLCSIQPLRLYRVCSCGSARGNECDVLSVVQLGTCTGDTAYYQLLDACNFLYNRQRTRLGRIHAWLRPTSVRQRRATTPTTRSRPFQREMLTQDQARYNHACVTKLYTPSSRRAQTARDTPLVITRIGHRVATKRTQAIRAQYRPAQQFPTGRHWTSLYVLINLSIISKANWTCRTQASIHLRRPLRTQQAAP